MTKTWWGTSGLGADQHQVLERAIADAINSADVLGIVPPRRILDSERQGAKAAQRQRQMFLRLGAYLLDEPTVDLPGKVVTTCHIHQAFIKWELYKEVLSGVSAVSVISCHDLSEVLPKNLGISVKRQYLIPPENAYADQFGSDPGRRHEAMFPDRYLGLRSELAIAPGEVVLVAAGFLGKHFCHDIKMAGGIGLDIGSAADYFLGHETRAYTHAAIFSDLRHGLIDGLDAENPPLVRTPERSVSTEVFTDEIRHVDVLERVRGRGEQGARSSQSYPLLVIGHPRCASNYIGDVLNACGVAVGHERFKRDGICSWMHVVRDANSPWGDAHSEQFSYAATLAYSRHPRDAIPSIAMENCQARSFRFRRFHIYDVLGVDIADYETAIERAIGSYVYWHQMVLQHSPLAIIRAENLAADLLNCREKLAQCGIDISAEQITHAAALDIKPNASAQKFLFDKPSYGKEDWARVDPLLLDELAEICDKLGYPHRDNWF